jgi:RNA polymerase sigma-70 factor (ECF subfamily)
LDRPDVPSELREPSDEALLAAFVAGDETAFGILLTRHQRRVYGICFRYFGDARDAEDAAQEAFLILYRRGSTFQGGSAFSTWLYRVTVNACNDLARRRGRRPRKADVALEDLSIADPRDGVERAMLRLDLKEALLQLQPDHREAVIGHTVEGRPYHEIAERSGVPVGTIKSRVHRGHAKLAAILAGDVRSSVERTERAPPPT